MRPVTAAVAIYCAILSLIYLSYGSRAFWWTVFGALLILLVVTLVDTARKWGH